LGELAGLRRRRVDVLRGRLEIVETAVEAGGKVTFKTPKSRAGRRGVPLPTVAHRALTEHLNAFTAPSGDALVFPSPQGDVLRATTWRRRYWNPAVIAADLAPLRVHDLRHTAVSLWIAAGDDAKVISVRAGHSSVAFTYDRYGHLFPESDERSRARLDALIGEATPAPSADVREFRR
jgi:integrase